MVVASLHSCATCLSAALCVPYLLCLSGCVSVVFILVESSLTITCSYDIQQCTDETKNGWLKAWVCWGVDEKAVWKKKK